LRSVAGDWSVVIASSVDGLRMIGKPNRLYAAPATDQGRSRFEVTRLAENTQAKLKKNPANAGP